MIFFVTKNINDLIELINGSISESNMLITTTNVVG